MSFKAVAYVKELSTCPNGAMVTRSEKLLLFVLADYHNPERNIAWPSVKRLANESLMSTRQVQRVIESLETKQVIKVDHGGNGRGDIARYIFLVFSSRKGDMVTPLPEAERVTFQPQKGDISESKRVTFQFEKGDILGSVKKNSKNLSTEPIEQGALKRFQPPTIEQITTYMMEQKVPNPLKEAVKFFAHHETRGWVPANSKRQMRSWKSAVITWRENIGNFNGNGHAAPRERHLAGWEPSDDAS